MARQDTHLIQTGAEVQAILNAVADKADKVASPTAGHLASLDANGNLADSGLEVDDVYEKPSSGIPASDLAEGVIPDISGIERILGEYSGDTPMLIGKDSNGYLFSQFGLIEQNTIETGFCLSVPTRLYAGYIYLLSIPSLPVLDNYRKFVPFAVRKHTDGEAIDYSWTWAEYYGNTLPDAAEDGDGNTYTFVTVGIAGDEVYSVSKNGTFVDYITPFNKELIDGGGWPTVCEYSTARDIGDIFPRYERTYHFEAAHNPIDAVPGSKYYVFPCDTTDDYYVSYMKPVTGTSGELLIVKYDVFNEIVSRLSAKYEKPENGIPASDLAAGVIPTVPTDVVKYSQQSLTDEQKTQARTNIGAYAKPVGGIPASDLAAGVLPDATNMQSYSYGATAPSDPKEGDIWVSETLTEIPIAENANELTFTKTASRYKLQLEGLTGNDSAVFEWVRASDSEPFNSADYKPDGTYYFDAPDYEIEDNELYLSLTYTDDLWEVATLWAVANTVHQYHNGSWVAMEVVTATEKAAWNAKYSKPSGGIPSTDLASGVIPDVSGFITKNVNDLTYYYTKTEVDGKVSSAYKAAGTVASVASLGTLDAAHEGFVYNMSASFTTTSDFVEGSGTTYPAGTNVAIVNTGTTSSPVYKYDVLAGFVDISGKADKSEMSVVDGTDANADKTTITLKSGTSATVLKSHQDISGKADKVSGATSGHLAALDGNGNLADSGKSASDLVVEANPTVPSGTTPVALTGLKIGNSYYSAPSVVALTNNEIDTIWTNAS